MTIGILDIQGSTEEHFSALKNISISRVKVEPVLVKRGCDFKNLDGLIIPGGESTTISKLLGLYGLDKEILAFAKRGGIIFGTCAGAILLARNVFSNGICDKRVKPFGLIDIDIDRNAYGRQLDSFETEIKVKTGKSVSEAPAVFIRAPKITRVSDSCEILAECNGDPVLVREKNILVATFHPEMTNDTTVYSYFVRMRG